MKILKTLACLCFCIKNYIYLKYLFNSPLISSNTQTYKGYNTYYLFVFLYFLVFFSFNSSNLSTPS